VRTERSLEIGEYVIAAGEGIVLRYDDVAFHRRIGEPGIFSGELHPRIGGGECAFRIAVGEMPDRYLVGAGARVEQGGGSLAGYARIDHGR
jgi:hypothetical protein